MQARHDIRHLEFARSFASRRHQSGNDLSGSCNFYGLAFLNPCGHTRKVISQVSDRGCFHRETNMSHALEEVNRNKHGPVPIHRESSQGEGSGVSKLPDAVEPPRIIRPLGITETTNAY